MVQPYIYYFLVADERYRGSFLLNFLDDGCGMDPGSPLFRHLLFLLLFVCTIFSESLLLWLDDIAMKCQN